MSSAVSQTREKYPLSPKKITKKSIGGLIGWGILFVPLTIALLIWFITSAETWVLLLTVGSFLIYTLLVGINIWYQKVYFDTYFYDLTDHFIVIRKGVIIPQEINIPYERVQDVYVDQDIFDRIFGIYDVHLSTATISSGMAAHIDGVEKAAADGLREHLLKTISTKLGRQSAPTTHPA